MSYQNFVKSVKKHHPHEPEFLQSVTEVMESVYDHISSQKKYKDTAILERIVEPERIVTFRVARVDDAWVTQINRWYRVQFNSALWPYKWWLRFHPTVNLSILKFLWFEQIFKNALTGLPMWWGKWWSDFDPKGKSDNEVMKFCQSFMTELSRHIWPNTDVPAGDIWVGAREIWYLFGQYKRLQNEFTWVLTGKWYNRWWSNIRPEATGYGLLYFVQEMLEHVGETIASKKICISGSGNVAQYAAQKAIELWAMVLTMSDSSGTIYDSEGIDTQKLEYIMDLKNVQRGRIKEYLTKYPKAIYMEKQRPWTIDCDIALPCATQNELELEWAKALVANNVMLVWEWANMPTTPDALEYLQKNKVMFSPWKASNAGGVATSGLEMSQNSLRLHWTREEVDAKLHEIMKNIHATCVEYGQEDGYVNYVKWANIAWFVKVADAMIEQGVY